MPQKYKIIQQLIDLWQEFEDQEENADFLKFGEPYPKAGRRQKKYVRRGDYNNRSDQHTVYERHGNAGDNFLLSRLSRFYDFYTKKFFSSLPINSQLEFQFLLLLNKSGMPKKRKLSNHNWLSIQQELIY